MTGSKNRTLVKVSEIKDLTGWNRKKLEKARLCGWVEMIRDKNTKQIFYILESLNPQFIKRSA